VPEKLREVYKKDWQKLNQHEVDQIVEQQVKFLRQLRPLVWAEKREEIQLILQKKGYLLAGITELTKEHVWRYLSHQGYKARPKVSRSKNVGQTSIGPIEIWRAWGDPLSDQVNGPLKCGAPSDINRIWSERPKKTVWDRLRLQKAKLARLFQITEEGLVDIKRISPQLRNFYADNSKHLRSQGELESIALEQVRLLKSLKDVQTIVNQQDTIKRLLQVNELAGNNELFSPALQRILNIQTRLYLLTHDQQIQLRQLQQEFIRNYRDEVIFPVKRDLTQLLASEGYKLALEDNVLNTSQIRYYFRSIDFTKWKLIREDSLQQMFNELKAFLKSTDIKTETSEKNEEVLSTKGIEKQETNEPSEEEELTAGQHRRGTDDNPRTNKKPYPVIGCV